MTDKFLFKRRIFAVVDNAADTKRFKQNVNLVFVGLEQLFVNYRLCELRRFVVSSRKQISAAEYLFQYLVILGAGGDLGQLNELLQIEQYIIKHQTYAAVFVAAVVDIVQAVIFVVVVFPFVKSADRAGVVTVRREFVLGDGNSEIIAPERRTVLRSPS